jgi:hypothetical protein
LGALTATKSTTLDAVKGEAAVPELDLDSERRQTHFLLDALLAEKVSAVRGLLEVMVEPLSNS